MSHKLNIRVMARSQYGSSSDRVKGEGNPATTAPGTDLVRIHA